MNKKDFNKKFKKEGGVQMLQKLMKEYKTLAEIAEVFGVSRERIRQWSLELFDKPYDSRKNRKEIKVGQIAQIMKEKGINKVKEVARNKYYIPDALDKLKQEIQ